MKKKYANPDEYLAVEKERRKTYPSYNAATRLRPFVAYDGEGITVDGVHKYILLANSRDTALEEYDRGISTHAAFKFLLDEKADNPHAIHIMYGMGYDANMMFHGMSRALSFRHLKMLAENKRVYWGNYEIRYIPRKCLTISEYDTPYIDKRSVLPSRSITIWDVLTFFQCSFVDALKGLFTPYEQEIMDIGFIEEQKKRRGEFTREDAESGLLLSYNLAECYALVDLMNRFRENCRNSGIELHRYDGAGAAASSLLRSNGLSPIITKSVNMLTSKEGLMDAVRVAYGGGRSEMFMYGHTDDKVYHYDIVGAFPNEMPDMCDLSDGEWIHITPENGWGSLPISHCSYDTPFTLYKVYWDYREGEFNTIFPFFYRSPWGEPRIQYPPQGYSWVWYPELQVALSQIGAYYPWKAPLILEKWTFIPNGTNRPFAFVRDMYEKRLEYKKQGFTGQALATKLALNAMPGKMAQTSGYSGIPHEKGSGVSMNVRDLPPYFNLAYAGWITSGVRAKVFRAAMQHPNSIIAIATDGIWSLEPLTLDVGENMGQWEFEVLDGFTSIQPGVYFTKKSDGNREGVYHYRGFNSGSISEEEVIRTWANRGYTVNVPTRRFVTMGTVLASMDDYEKLWCTWHDAPRKLDIQQGMSTKRVPILLEGEDFPTARAATELVHTYADYVARFEDNVLKYGAIDKHGTSMESYLSRAHDVPWLDGERIISRRQASIDAGEAIAWDIIDSEV